MSIFYFAWFDKCFCICKMQTIFGEKKKWSVTKEKRQNRRHRP